jgi:hypothetical protein
MAVCLLLDAQAAEADVPTDDPPGSFRSLADLPTSLRTRGNAKERPCRCHPSSGAVHFRHIYNASVKILLMLLIYNRQGAYGVLSFVETKRRP